MPTLNRDELIRRVSEGDHSQCQHDLLGTCPVELALEILQIRKQDADADNLPSM